VGPATQLPQRPEGTYDPETLAVSCDRRFIRAHRLAGAEAAAREEQLGRLDAGGHVVMIEDAVSQGGANLRLLRLTGASPIEGGVPIMADGKVIGAVGISGGTAPQDGQVAKAGVDALK
jgi:hypothetical protein